MRILRVHGSKPKYHHHWVGGNFRLDALQAAILQIKLPFLDQWAEARRQNAHHYHQCFTQSQAYQEGVLIPPYQATDCTHVFNQFVIRTPHRDALKQYLAEHKIGTMIYYPSPLHTQPCFKELGYKAGDFPHAEKACQEVLALPVYPELSTEQVEYISHTVLQFFKEHI